MNGPIAAACSVVSGGAAAFAVLLVAAGRPTEAVLFALVALVAGAELVALLDRARLVVCVLVSAYAFVSAFLLPVDARHAGAHHAGGHGHATAR